MADTIPLPTAEEAMRVAVNRSSKRSKTITVGDDQQVAIIKLDLHSSVTPADYASLGSQINAITGLSGANLLIDGTTRAAVAEGYEQTLTIEAHLRTREVPETP